MPEIKILPKNNGRDKEIQNQKIKIKLFDDSIGDRTRLSDLQEKTRYAINQFMKEIEDPAVQKTGADFNRQYDRVVELQDKLTEAQKTQKDLEQRYYDFNSGLYHLSGTEIGILSSIKAGLDDAVETEESKVVKLIGQRRLIEKQYSDQWEVPIHTMSPEQKKNHSENKAKAKAEMIKQIQALDIKGSRFGSLREIEIKQAKIGLMIRAINGYCDIYYPVPENVSALQTQHAVENMIRAKSISQAHGAELKNA